MKGFKYFILLLFFIAFTGIGRVNANFPISDKPNQEVKIYPVPVLDYKFSIISETKQIIEVKVLNVLGQQVYRKENLNDNILRIGLETKDKGLYIVQVLTSDKNITTKRVLFK